VYRFFFKRVIDFILSFAAFLILSPLFLLVALLLFISNKETPFFFQIRPGLRETPFTVIKFKTMNNARDQKGELLSDELRLTSIGKFVRKTSLDEIPQLLNVIKGDMSLIGPRPLLMEYLPLYSKEQRKRHEVRPGITGWAQVNGRNTISWKKKFEYDVWYVNNISFLVDLKIILLTLYKVAKAEGISGEGVVTATKFDGNN
jgi:undecaprenyl phosphate N,N'-diacetylbacillosamine 1-phosphate transferase